jgi:hypothetical protein
MLWIEAFRHEYCISKHLGTKRYKRPELRWIAYRHAVPHLCAQIAKKPSKPFVCGLFLHRRDA